MIKRQQSLLLSEKKPDSLTVIPPWEAEEVLASQPVTELSGINKGIATFLRQYGVVFCGDMKRLPMAVLAQRYGNPGRRIWLMAQGKDPEKVHTNIAPPKTMGHGKNMPPETKDRHMILIYFQHMSEKLAARLRLYHFRASEFFIALKTQQGWLRRKIVHPYATDDGQVIFSLCQRFLSYEWHGEGAWQVRIVALDLQSQYQGDLFDGSVGVEKRTELNKAVDKINQKFGEFAIAPSRLVDRSEMPNVISPSWQPTGHRNTI